MKNRIEMSAEKLRLNTVPERLWQYISVGFTINLLVSRDHDLILVVYNRFLKMLHFIVIMEKIMVES